MLVAKKTHTPYFTLSQLGVGKTERIGQRKKTKQLRGDIRGLEKMNKKQIYQNPHIFAFLMLGGAASFGGTQR